MHSLHQTVSFGNTGSKRLHLLLAIGFSLLSAGAAAGRSVYLNGVDISGATTQQMKGVDLQINEAGDVFITAPNYEVHEEDTYLPLSSYMKAGQPPAHKAPQSVPADQVKSIALDQLPSQPANKGLDHLGGPNAPEGGAGEAASSAMPLGMGAGPNPEALPTASPQDSPGPSLPTEAPAAAAAKSGSKTP